MTAAPHLENDVRALLRGVLILTVFGLAWSVLAITGLGAGTVVTVALVIVAVALAAVVHVTARRWRTGPGAVAGRPRRISPNAGRVFTLVNTGQWVLIMVAVFGLVSAGRGGLIPPVICLIVGLHFVPLARIFDVPAYRWTAALLVVIAVGAGAGYASGLGDAAVRVIAGFPAAAVIWSSALVVAKRG